MNQENAELSGRIVKVSVIAHLDKLKGNKEIYEAFNEKETIDYYEPKWGDTKEELLNAVSEAIDAHGLKLVRNACKTKIKTNVQDNVRKRLIKILEKRYAERMDQSKLAALLGVEI